MSTLFFGVGQESKLFPSKLPTQRNLPKREPMDSRCTLAGKAIKFLGSRQHIETSLRMFLSSKPSTLP